MSTSQSTSKPRKVVACNQAAIDALPADSGDWKVEGVLGLLVRAGRRGPSFRLQRRVRGRLVVRVLGPVRLSEARREALRLWPTLRPRTRRLTLKAAWETYLAERPLSETTRRIYSNILKRFLTDWEDRDLASIADDRAGFRARVLEVQRNHGLAEARLTLAAFSAVYRYQRAAHVWLPESPTTAVRLPNLRARDWALSDDELRRWWGLVVRLSELRRTWWTAVLLTGARRDSVLRLRWQDVDLADGVLRFSTVKGGRCYSVPMSDRLRALLAGWRDRAIPGAWVFESPLRAGQPVSRSFAAPVAGISPHRLRHTFRTRLVGLGATPDQARLLLGHSLGGDVSTAYITAPLLIESLRPLTNKLAEEYARVLGWDGDATAG